MRALFLTVYAVARWTGTNVIACDPKISQSRTIVAIVLRL